MKKRVLLCEFSQESNSFSPLVWGIDRFRSMALCGGFPMKALFHFFKSPVRGMEDAVKEAGGKSVYGFAMRAMSGGPVADEAVELFLSRVKTAVEQKGPFDALLLSLHGATISESREDVCGYITASLRALLGKEVLIGLSLDMHANVTAAMRENADYISGFQTYPHIDMCETGYRVGKVVMAALAGKKYTQIYAPFSMIVPASGYTTAEGVMKEVMDEGFAFQKEGHAADFTVFMMQPWLDVKEASSTVTFVTEEPEAALLKAKEMAARIFRERSAFWPEKTDVEAVKEAILHHEKGKPVVWAEPADSPNAGAVGDSVELLKLLLDWHLPIRGATVVMDPAAAKQAAEIGVGGEGEFRLGAGYTPGMGEPLTLKCRVKKLSNGHFRMAGPAGKGVPMKIGNTAVLESGGMDILVCERPGATGDVNFYRGFGMKYEDYDVMVVKANTSFRECYKNIASSIFVADTYGAAGANLTALPFRNIPRDTMYPFSEQSQNH